MNPDLLKILNTYEDFELAFLSKYKLTSYLPETQKSIRTYITHDRKLSANKINELIKEKVSETPSSKKKECPRCKSNKLNIRDVEWIHADHRRGYKDDNTFWSNIEGKAIFKEEIKCNICGLWIEDPNEQGTTKPFFAKIFDFILYAPFRAFKAR